MKFLKNSLAFLLIVALLIVVNCKAKEENKTFKERSNLGRNFFQSSNSAIDVVREFVEAGMNADFKKLTELCCKDNGPFTTLEEVKHLNLEILGFIEKIVREERSEVDPDNIKIVVVRLNIKGRMGVCCFYVFRTPKGLKIYLNGDYLREYPLEEISLAKAVVGFYTTNNYNLKKAAKIAEYIVNSNPKNIKAFYRLIYIYSLLGRKIEDWLPQYNQKVDMKDITIISTALADYLTDNGVVPTQEGIYDENSEIYEALIPFYLRRLPIKDVWGNNYRAYCGTACNGVYGISGAGGADFIVVSYGRDGEKETWEFDPSDPEAGLYVRSINNLDKDLIMWNGSWIRAPMSAVR